MPRRGGREADRRRNRSKVEHKLRECIKIVVVEQCDGMCWICENDVDLKLEWPHPLCAVMDHLVEFAVGGLYRPENLLLAHRICNELRGRGKV
jgi:hypothetical protein